MSPKRRDPQGTKNRKAKTSKATTRPDRLIELAECLDTLLSLDLVFYTPFVVGEPEPDSPAGLKYCEESRLFKLKVEQAEKELVQLKQKTMATLQDSLAFVEEGEAVVIMAVVDRFNICVRCFYEAHSGPLYSDEFEAYRDRLNELAARLRVRAAKKQEGRVGVRRPRGRRAPKKHKPVLIKDAAQICRVAQRTIKNWEAGKHTPERWPGRDDAIALRAFMETKKSQAATRRGLKNMARGGTTDNLPDRDEEERQEAWSNKNLHSL